VRRLLPLIALALFLAACGSTKHAAPTTVPAAAAGPSSVLGAGAHTLYPGGDWAVVLKGTHVAVAHRVGGRWRIDRSRGVRLDVLAPHGTAAALPQVAVELTAKAPIVEEGLWVDGTELVEKGGGPTSHRITVYGAPEHDLRPGRHVAVAYARTDAGGGAVAWTFRVG
jgi:hypothetical protein